MNDIEPHPTPSRIDCEAAARALYDYLDRGLPPAYMDDVQRHLETCRACAAHFEFSRRVLQLVPTAVPLEPGSEELRVRILEALRIDGRVEP